jgi:phosphate-selective porin
MNSRKLVKLALAGISAIAVSGVFAASANVSGQVRIDATNNSGFASKDESMKWSFARVRLVVSGKLSDDISHYVRLDRASDDTIGFSQGHITYTGVEGLSLRFGKHTVQYGHENWRDGAGLNILSYAFGWGHTPDAQFGLTGMGSSDSMSFGVSMFDDKGAEGNKTKYGMSGRVVFSPMSGDDMFGSVGLSYQSRPKQAGTAVTAAASHLANGQKWHSWDVDAALAMGPFGAVAEYDNKSVSNTYDAESKKWMVELTYILTGQNRSHSGKWGTLDGVKTEGRPAFDVGFVYSKDDTKRSYKQHALDANGVFQDSTETTAFFTTSANGAALTTAQVGAAASGDNTKVLADGTGIKGTHKKTSWTAGVGYQMQDNLRFQLTYASQKQDSSYKVNVLPGDSDGTAIAAVGTAVYEATLDNSGNALDPVTGSGLAAAHQKANSYKLRVDYVF